MLSGPPGPPLDSLDVPGPCSTPIKLVLLTVLELCLFFMPDTRLMRQQSQRSWLRAFWTAWTPARLSGCAWTLLGPGCVLSGPPGPALDSLDVPGPCSTFLKLVLLTVLELCLFFMPDPRLMRQQSQRSWLRAFWTAWTPARLSGCAWTLLDPS